MTDIHLDGFWLDSDNKAQAEVELAGGDNDSNIYSQMIAVINF